MAVTMTRRARTAAVALVLLVVAVRVLALGWYPATSNSMAPTIARGDRVVVDKLVWRLRDLGPGDLVTFSSPVDGERLVKRVVAVAGDTVALEDAVLVVNGRPVREPYVDHSRIDGTYFGPVTVPPGHLFVLGDNRFGSIDSRVYGPVPLDAVTGRVLAVLG
jgi:signal peptidase I